MSDTGIGPAVGNTRESEIMTRPALSRYREEGIPILMASGEGLAAAWEHSLLTLWNMGCHIENQYEENLPEGHQLSVDATMMIIVNKPMSEPAIHRCFPGGLNDLEEYRMEFLDGIKDHWVKTPDDPSYSGEWTYTYHQRFAQYQYFAPCDSHFGGRTRVCEARKIDQIAAAVEALARAPHTRRVKLATWQPWLDPTTNDPPCLGEFWLRCSQLPDFDGYVLNGNAIFRSRDAFDAAFWNLWAEVAFMERIAGELQVRLGKPVRVGRLCDLSHSYHIYGKRVEAFRDLFLHGVATKSWEERTWTREFAQPIFDEARPRILEKIRRKDAGLSPV